MPECEGFRVRVKFKSTSPYGQKEVILNNVTEIHYTYNRPLGWKSIAFESDIHSTGINYQTEDIDEFEAVCQKEIEKEF